MNKAFYSGRNEKDRNEHRALPLYGAADQANSAASAATGGAGLSATAGTLSYVTVSEEEAEAERAANRLAEQMVPYGEKSGVYSFGNLYAALRRLCGEAYPMVDVSDFPTRANVMVGAHVLFFEISFLLRLMTRAGRTVKTHEEEDEDEVRIFLTADGTLPPALFPDRRAWIFLQREAGRFSFRLMPVLGDVANGFCFAVGKVAGEIRLTTADVAILRRFFLLANEYF